MSIYEGQMTDLTPSLETRRQRQSTGCHSKGKDKRWQSFNSTSQLRDDTRAHGSGVLGEGRDRTRKQEIMQQWTERSKKLNKLRHVTVTKMHHVL